jgi:tRNA G18 (ribose-2'-O)-methylase SpoU
MVFGAHPTRSPAGVIPVASLDDPRLAEYRLLANPTALREQGLFVAEGRLVVRRLLRTSGFRVRSILVTRVAYDALRLMLEEANTDVFVVDQITMNGIVGFNIHRGCLALAERPRSRTLVELSLETMKRMVVLEGVNNPDNVGGIFRSAAAFGTDAVILGPACSDPLYRKSVRTSMAATLAVPFAESGFWPEALTTLKDSGFRVFALTPAADAKPIVDVRLDAERVAILVGAEGDGLSAAALGAADERVRIPTAGAVDSLNVTTATSIALFLAQRSDRIQLHGSSRG